MSARLRTVGSAFLLLYGVVALALSYWAVARAPGLLAREDNPRRVEAELRVQRGRILDRYDGVLAETVGQAGALERVYPDADGYSPVVGTYSLRYGVSGVEASYDDVLRGDAGDPWQELWDDALHRNPVGRDVQLTLDAEVQSAAAAALGEYQGAAVVLDARSGEILALVSRPSYDPNQFDLEFEALSADPAAPLLSRPTQGLYQPGTALQPLLVAIAIERATSRPHAAVSDLSVSVAVDGSRLSCASTPAGTPATIASAMAHSCPAPFLSLAQALGAEALADGMVAVGLLESPDLPIHLAASTPPELEGAGDRLEAEAVGQGEMTLSPLQLAWAVAGIANDGVLPTLRLVRRVGTDEAVLPQSRSAVSGMSAETAAAITQIMLEAVETGAAMEAAIEGVQVAGHVAVAIAGPAGERNAWFLGFAPATALEPFTRYVVTVLLESSSEPTAAARAGGAILEAILD